MKCGFCGNEMELEARPAKSLYRCECGAIRFVGGTVCVGPPDYDHFREVVKLIGKDPDNGK